MSNFLESLKGTVDLLNGAADCLGKIVGKGKGTGYVMMSAPIVALIAQGIKSHLDKEQLKKVLAEKERIYQETLRRHEAAIRVLETKTEIAEERQKELLAYKDKLHDAILQQQIEIRELKAQIG